MSVAGAPEGHTMSLIDSGREDIQLDTYQFEVRRALEMYQAGADSLGYVAEKVGLSKRDLIREARTRGIEPPFDEQTVREELGTWTPAP